MPNGLNTMLNLQGKTTVANGLQTTSVTVTLPLGPLTPFGQLQGRVDANNKLVVTEP